MKKGIALAAVLNAFAAFFAAAFTLAIPVELITGMDYADLVTGTRAWVNITVVGAVYWSIFMVIIRW